MSKKSSLKTQLRTGFSSQTSEDLLLCNLDFSDYYKLLHTTIQKWNDDTHENLFKFIKIS